MITLDIIRHGAVAGDVLYGPEAELSELGEWQVDELVRRYAHEGTVFSAVFRSPLPRADATAENLPSEGDIIVVDDLREPDWGELLGTPFEDLPKQPNGRGYDLFAVDAGQEPFADVAARYGLAFAVVKAAIRPGQHGAIVSHGLPSKFLMRLLRDPNALLPQSEAEMPDDDQLGNAQAQRMIFDDEWHLLREERIEGTGMDAKQEVKRLQVLHPGANIVAASQFGGKTTEVIAELGLTEDGLSSQADVIADRAHKHEHHETTEVYQVEEGTLHVFIDGVEHVLHVDDDPITIRPGQQHYVVGDATRFSVVSTPPWKPEDYFAVG